MLHKTKGMNYVGRLYLVFPCWFIGLPNKTYMPDWLFFRQRFFVILAGAARILLRIRPQEYTHIKLKPTRTDSGQAGYKLIMISVLAINESFHSLFANSNVGKDNGYLLQHGRYVRVCVCVIVWYRVAYIRYFALYALP